MPDILLSSYTAQRMRTASGNAVAADIGSTKTALVNGLLVTGTNDMKPLASQGGIVALITNPLAISDPSYQPGFDHDSRIILDTGATDITSSSSWVLLPDGNAYHPSAFQPYFKAEPPAYTTRRKYEMWGSFIDDGALVNACGFAIYTNYVDGNNYWYHSLRYNTGTALFYSEMREVVAAVNTLRGTVNFGSAVDFPINFHLTVYEQGDAVLVQAGIYETDSMTDDEVVAYEYTVASRPLKSEMNFQFTNASGGGNNARIQGCKVTDLL